MVWFSGVSDPTPVLRVDELMGLFNSPLPSYYSQDVGGPLVTGAQSSLTSPILGPFAMNAENSPPSPGEYTRATSTPLSVALDPPAWPTLQRPIDMAQESYKTFRPPCISEFEYSPVEYGGSYIDLLGPCSVESAQQAVISGIGSDGSGILINGPGSEQLRVFSEANTIGPSEEVWVPFVCPPAGQATLYQPSGGTGARVEIHPPTHVLGRGKCGLYCIGEGEAEVALSSGEMNREE